MSGDGRTGAVFDERQRFRQVPLVVLVGAFTVWAWVALLIAVRSDERSWSLWWSWAIAVVFGIGLPWFLWTLELRTTVAADGVDVRFAPRIGGHHFAVGDIAASRAVTYHPLKEFGGWGVRWGAKGARAYNVAGTSGVEVVDATGRRWIIGSQRAGELAAAIAGLAGDPGVGAD